MMLKYPVSDVKKTTTAYRGRKRVYYYDRETGERIDAEYGTVDFLLKLEAIRAKEGVEAEVDTFGQLSLVYRKSPEFDGLSARTKSDYKKVLEYLEKMGDVLLSSIDTPYLNKIKDSAYLEKKRKFTNDIRAVCSLMFNWGRRRGYMEGNPAAEVDRIKRPKNAREVNRKWGVHEVQIVLDAAKPNMKVAIAVGYYLGFRQGDVIKIPLNAILDGWLEWRQNKNAVLTMKPIPPELEPYIEIARQQENRKATTLVIGERGRSYTGNGFRTAFFRLIRSLEKEGKVAPGLTFHGLRHTVGAELAERGAGDEIIQNALGHKTPHQARIYRRGADQKKGAVVAMELRRKNTD